MNAGLVEREPQAGPDYEEQGHGADPENPEGNETEDENAGDAERREIDVIGIEDRDHHDRAHVIDDRQREQKELQRRIDSRRPNRLTTPIAIAMSVAIGMPHPPMPSPPALMAT